MRALLDVQEAGRREEAAAFAKYPVVVLFRHGPLGVRQRPIVPPFFLPACLPPSLAHLTALPSQSAEPPWPFIHTGSHSHDGGRYGAATPARLSFIPTLPARLVLQLVRDPHGSLPLSPSLCCCSLPLKLVSATRHPFIDSWSSTPSSHRPCSGSRQSAPIGPSGKWLAGWLVVVLLLLLMMMYSGVSPSRWWLAQPCRDTASAEEEGEGGKRRARRTTLLLPPALLLLSCW